MTALRGLTLWVLAVSACARGGAPTFPISFCGELVQTVRAREVSSRRICAKGDRVRLEPAVGAASPTAVIDLARDRVDALDDHGAPASPLPKGTIQAYLDAFRTAASGDPCAKGPPDVRCRKLESRDVGGRRVEVWQRDWGVTANRDRVPQLEIDYFDRALRFFTRRENPDGRVVELRHLVIDPPPDPRYLGTAGQL